MFGSVVGVRVVGGDIGVERGLCLRDVFFRIVVFRGEVFIASWNEDSELVIFETSQAKHYTTQTSHSKAKHYTTQTVSAASKDDPRLPPNGKHSPKWPNT